MSPFVVLGRPVAALAAGLSVASFSVHATGIVTTLPTSGLDADATFSFSKSSQTLMSAMGMDVVGLGNSHLSAGATNWSFDMPVTQVTLSASLLPLSITPVAGKATGSGLGIYGTDGGLTLANFSLDFNRNVLSADFSSAQGTVKNFDVFSFKVADGLHVSTDGGLSLNMSLNHMTLTAAAQDRFSTALALEPFAVAALGILDFGSLNVNISPALRFGVSDKVLTAMPVPEAPSMLAMGLGLLGIAAVSRRHQVSSGS